MPAHRRTETLLFLIVVVYAKIVYNKLVHFRVRNQYHAKKQEEPINDAFPTNLPTKIPDRYSKFKNASFSCELEITSDF